MLLKRIDETISEKLFDLESRPDEVEVYLAEPSIGEGLVEWTVVGRGFAQRRQLHYNDATDGSNKFIKSWQKFYASGAKLGEYELFNGSTSYFANGSANFGGVAKAGIYLRYSAGFLDWLAAFDPETAGHLRDEIPKFEALMVNRTNKLLPGGWHKFKIDRARELWPLIAVCRLSSGKFLALWLAEDCDDDGAELAELGIDVARSRELMKFTVAPECKLMEVISDEFQSGVGLGRNAFDHGYNLDKIRRSEYIRLLGAIPENDRSQMLDLWGRKLEYRVRVAPSPDTSWMIFLPEGDLKYSRLKEFIDNENQKVRIYRAGKKKKKAVTDDTEAVSIAPPVFIPIANCATIFLTNVEGSTKKKRIVQQIFPSVSLQYLQYLNSELLRSNIQDRTVNYMKAALTGQGRDTPSVYRYWTTLFTSALQKRPISGREVFFNFQRFAKSHTGEDLIDKLAARRYFELIGKLLRLQHLIVTAQSSPERLREISFECELNDIEQFNGIKTGVFGPMSTTMPTGSELIGEACGLLREKQRTKLDNFIRQAWAGVPTEEFQLFVRGALAGMLLNELCWIVRQNGRSFSATQGIHPSRLRGRELLRIFDKGIGLLLNLGEEQAFNCRMLPFLKSLEPESRRDTFNSGLITGLVYFEKKNEDNEEVNHD
ncbi:MAG: hypothetical protein PHI85_08855 [Victivallaceae bacterium]|nr:hypothetical protein [Victivallaceae bacterium]